MQNIGLGAIESKKDKRTVNHSQMTTMATTLPISGGVHYLPADIEMQSKVGICTAISLTQNAEKALGKKFSADFQYLLQKKYYDGNWMEGSSILNALKVGTKYGFLPEELWTFTTQADRDLPYPQYMAKLQAVSDADIQKLLLQCTDKLTGYAQLGTDPQSLSQGINSSRSGILCMYIVGSEWWTAPDGRISWSPADINPLRKYTQETVVSGHSIIGSYYDYSSYNDVKLANTWSVAWNVSGIGDVDVKNYPPREAWIPYYQLTPAQTLQLQNNLKQQISILQQIITILKELISRSATKLGLK